MNIAMVEDILNAIWNADLVNIKNLVAQGVDLNYNYSHEEHFKNKMNGQTILSHAASYGNLSVVTTLIELGASIKLCEFDLLACACDNSRDNPEILKYLIASGINVNVLNEDVDEDEIITTSILTYLGNNPIVDVDTMIEVIGILINHGAHVNFRHSHTGKSILHYAVDYKNSKLVDALVNRFGAAGDLADSGYGHTALDLAVYEELHDIAKIIVDSHVNLNVTSSGRSVLHIAVLPKLLRRGDPERDQLDFVRHILSKGAEVDLRRFDNMTPLAIVCERAYRYPEQAVRLINLLMEYGADLTVKVGIDPCEPLPVIVMRNENNRMPSEIRKIFEKFI